MGITLKILGALVGIPHEVLIVHDTPDDDSVPVVRSMQHAYPNIRTIHNTLGPGVANAVRTGVNEAVAPHVLIAVCDDVGWVFAVEDMLALMDQGCEFVSGTRYAHGGRRLGGASVGGLLSRTANWLFRFLAASALSDTTTGFKMFRRSDFDRFDLDAHAAGWVTVLEMAIKAQILGLKLGECPVTSVDRLYGGGQSTFRLGPWFAAYLKWFLWSLWHLRRASGGTRTLVRRTSTSPE